MTQEILKQNECRTLIFYVRDFLARHSQSLDEGKDLPMQEEPFSLKLPDWLQTNDLRIFSLKTYPVCFRMTKGGRFTPSSVRYLNWGIHVTEKPLQLMKDVIQICEPGGLILDPFAGAGTTILAAAESGFQAVGIEVTDSYYKLGSDRVRIALEAGEEAENKEPQ